MDVASYHAWPVFAHPPTHTWCRGTNLLYASSNSPKGTLSFANKRATVFQKGKSDDDDGSDGEVTDFIYGDGVFGDEIAVALYLCGNANSVGKLDFALTAMIIYVSLTLL